MAGHFFSNTVKRCQRPFLKGEIRGSLPFSPVRCLRLAETFRCLLEAGSGLEYRSHCGPHGSCWLIRVQASWGSWHSLSLGPVALWMSFPKQVVSVIRLWSANPPVKVEKSVTAPFLASVSLSVQLPSDSSLPL